MPRLAWPATRPAEQVYVLDGSLVDGLEPRRSRDHSHPLKLRQFKEMLLHGLWNRVDHAWRKQGFLPVFK